ncbi:MULTISPECIES: sugar phosphate isomerase/epimerase family protein [Paraclostridium]|uniref:sugar phosphate isomerase/epimerase family protein n=1 Tax=Paraclostridium TaxID=1849822 RepID=UPI0014757590|nr:MULTISPECIES: TIM barrel protein [Paraclostridium]MCU9811149.1 TIM barrel protein [Paraclostridium sp. AKS81]
MIEIGCLARFFNRYEDEVEFAKRNNFDLMQLWYDNRGLSLHKDDGDFINTIKYYKFPTIVHAVLDLNEFEEHIPKLLDILNELDHKEIIIHPICQSESIDENTLEKLDKMIKFTLDIYRPYGITVFLENNSKLDPIFTDTHEIEKIFKENEELEFILDIAHIDNMQHIREMVSCKNPKILHIADKHFDILHEHLPIGYGEIDFEYIFKNILNLYEGKIILEIANDDSDIVNSKKIIENIISAK